MKKPRLISAARLASWPAAAERRMARSRAATLRFLARLPDSAVREPGAQGTWSVKDTVAHFVAWEEEAVKRLDLIRRGRGARVKFYEDMDEVDRFNARVVARARRESWRVLLRRAARVRAALGRAIRRLPAAALQDPNHVYPVTLWLPEFAWDHEQSHLRRLRAWWKKRK